MRISHSKTWAQLQDRVAALLSHLWVPHGIALFGGLVFLLASVVSAHGQRAVIDEGLYLYKGYLFASGRYIPFEDYGLWTNHMPLSFLIPGYVQRLFGPGLRTGRYLAIVESMLLLIGLWLLTKRLRGAWWGSAVVWAMALNIGGIRIYSQADTQALGAALLIWCLVLIAGRDRKNWHMVVGGLLTGAMFVTRINLAPALPLILLYVFWQSGFRQGLIASFSAALPIIGFHLLYWPDIIKLWASIIPEDMLAFLNPWRLTHSGEFTTAAETEWDSIVLSVMQAFRFHFAAFFGAMITIAFWSRRRAPVSETSVRVGAFMIVLFLSLALFNAWGAIGGGFCVFCFRSYSAYYAPLGLLALATSFGALNKTPSSVRQLGALMLLAVILIGLGFSTFGDYGESLIRTRLPRLGEPGALPLWEILSDRLGWSFGVSRRIVPAALGSAAVGVVIILAWGIGRGMERVGGGSPGAAFLAWITVLLLGSLLSPTGLLGGGYAYYLCGGDVIMGYERAGRELESQIDAGQLIYWDAYAPVLLLYIPDVEIFPPQLNAEYSFAQGGDPDQLVKFGRWNQALADIWLRQADHILVEETSLSSYAEGMENGELLRSGVVSSPEPCRPEGKIHIFRMAP